jgi:hypothetical protein
MSLAISLQHRLDALRRKCSTGYGCGSSCISLRKECRTSPRSAIGKERMKRLLELAAGGASSQRGIAQVRQKEAGELAGAIGARRGEKAAQFRSGRQQVAAEKAKAAAEKQAAEAAAAKAATVQLKLDNAKRVNTYLTQPTGHELWPTRKQAEEMEPMFDALLARVTAEKFPGPNNRTDSRDERIQRLVQEAYQAAVADRRADASLQQRIDALRASCTHLNG